MTEMRTKLRVQLVGQFGKQNHRPPKIPWAMLSPNNYVGPHLQVPPANFDHFGAPKAQYSHLTISASTRRLHFGFLRLRDGKNKGFCKVFFS
jgi:hypothetical protein